MAKKRSARASAGAGDSDCQARGTDAVSSAPVSTSVGGRDEHAAPPDADLSYISPDLRPLAVLASSLTLDPINVKDHGEKDLPTHAASLLQFGIRRAVVVRRSNRQIEAGNGTVLASQQNGWQYVPVIFEDDDHQQAQAFALADNAVGTLADWNDQNLAAVMQDVDGLFSDPLLKNLTADLAEQLEQIEEELSQGAEASETQETPAEPAKPDQVSAESIELSYRVIATCADQAEQIKLLAELESRGLKCRLSTVRVESE